MRLLVADRHDALSTAVQLSDPVGYGIVPGRRRVERQLYGLGVRSCREIPVKPGSVIFTKSGGIHGIRNPSADKPLRFVAFLYHTS